MTATRPGPQVAAAQRIRTAPRSLLLIPGAFALLAGLDAALILLGLGAPVTARTLADAHGILMTLGFVGTVVALERAVAAGTWWSFSSPAGFGLGAVALVTPAPRALSGALLLLGAVALVATYVALWRRNAAVAVLVQAGGGVLAVGAALLWLADVPIPWSLPWLMCFLVLTIAGERLELARVALRGAAAEPVAALITTGIVLAVAATLLWPAVGYPLLGALLLALVWWLLTYDVARHTVRARGLARFSAACLLAGYAWLAVTGVCWLVLSEVRDGPGYDAIVHAVMLGFVISMIMAHAPIILPAVLRRPLPYTPVMYVPAALLHASLVLRLLVGDARGVAGAVQLGGVLNIVAVLGFVAVAAWSAVTARQSRSQRLNQGSLDRETGAR